MSDESNRNPIMIYGIIGLGLFIALIAGAFLVGGPQFGLTILKAIAVLIAVLCLLGGVISVIIWLTAKRKIDMLTHRNKEIIKACKLVSVPYKQELWFRGDSYLSTRKIGEIIGFCVQATEPEYEVKRDKNKEWLEVKGDGNIRPLILIAFKSKMFQNPFSSDKIKVFCGPQEDIAGGFKSLSSERIFLNGTTFAPSLYGQFMLSKHWHDTTMIDLTVASNVYRYTMVENLRESKSLVDYAINLDANFVKHRETTILDQIPISK